MRNNSDKKDPSLKRSFGDEYQSERYDPVFLAAFVEAALEVFRAVA